MSLDTRRETPGFAFLSSVAISSDAQIRSDNCGGYVTRFVRLLFAGLFAATSSAAALAQAPVNLRKVPQNKAPADWPQRGIDAAPNATITIADRNLMLTLLEEPRRVFLQNVKNRKNYVITGNTGFEDQRGKPGGCGIPTSASAVSLTLQSSNSSAEGTLLVGVKGSPTLPALNFRPNATLTTQVMTPLSDDGFVGLRAQDGTTRVTAWVNGYYTEQLAAHMNNDGTLYAASRRVTASWRIGTGSYRIDFDRDILGCAVHVTIADGPYYGSGFSDVKSVYVNTWILNTNADPVPQDLYFMASVVC